MEDLILKWLKITRWVLLLGVLCLVSCQERGAATRAATPGASHSPVPVATAASPSETETPASDASPVSGEWVVELEVVRDPGTSGSGGDRLVARSSGVYESTQWQNGVAGPQPRTHQRAAEQEGLRRLAMALGDSQVDQAPPVPDPSHSQHGVTVHKLSWTREGKKVEAVSYDGQFPPGWQALKSALEGVTAGPAAQGVSEFRIAYTQPDPQKAWNSRELSLDGLGQAEATYHLSRIEGSWNFLEGTLAPDSLSKLKASVGKFEFPATEERSTGQGEHMLRIQSGNKEHIYFSKDGVFPAPAAAMAEMLKELYPKAVGASSWSSVAWRPAPADR